jgi:N-hydroxyarylamine O-acetyltransferase
MAEIDLDSYFARVGYSGPKTATLETLRALHVLHPTAITFENIDPLMRRPVRLDLSTLTTKLVEEKRGGYCYEQNTLFAAVLRSLGFSVTTVAARAQHGAPSGVVRSRTHMVLRIDLPEGPHICDVGYGRLTLTAPLRFAPDIEQLTPHGPYRLVQIGDEFQLQAKLNDLYVPVYQFSTQEQLPVDWEVANWFNSTHPESTFTKNLMVARPVEERRLALFNSNYRIYFSDGRTERRTLQTTEELASVLQNDFKINLPDGWEPIFDQLLQRK